ncbi:FAD-binding monooxygenase moxY [Exophiala dermatitidis]
MAAGDLTAEVPPVPTEQPDPAAAKKKPSLVERPVKAIIVGAGIGGIATAVLLSHKVKNLSYTLYDRNDRVSGTWAENTYPGVRCDVPSHVYQLTFAPNPDWSEYYSKGSEIQKYYEGVVRDYGVAPNVRLLHEVLSARWIADKFLWEFEIKDLSSGTSFKDTAEFFISAPGRVNEPNIPPIPGLKDFQGTIIHTARWNSNVDIRGKRVAIIGNGASGQQILPNIVNDTAHIDHYVRGKTYVSPTFRQGLKEASVDIPGGYVYTEEEKRTFRESGRELLAYRHKLEKTHYGAVNNTYGVLGSEGNKKFRESLLQTMLERVNGDKEWLARLTPDYGPGCKRLTPAPGYLEAIIGTKVEYVDIPIKRVTSTGVETIDGKVRNIDVLILATGFRDGFYPRFPTIVKNGDDLSQIWKPGGKVGFPETYLGITAPNAPNYFFVLQAQGNAFGGSVPYQCEISATYIARLIRKVQREGYRALYPSDAAAKDFSVVVDQYFDKSVVNDKCRTYFKLEDKLGKSRNVLGYPGTTRQRLEVLAEPRWEDFVFEDGQGSLVTPVDYLAPAKSSPTDNRFLRFWGAGRSSLDENDSLDAMISAFLAERGKSDLRTLHERF